jgi:hypothetical protein
MDPQIFPWERALLFDLAYRPSAGCDACCPVALGFQSRRILQAFPFSFCAGVDCCLHNCARARRAGVAVATTRPVATIRVAGQMAVAASTRVRTGLDSLLYCGFGRVVRDAQMAARVVSQPAAGADCEIQQWMIHFLVTAQRHGVKSGYGRPEVPTR